MPISFFLCFGKPSLFFLLENLTITVEDMLSLRLPGTQVSADVIAYGTVGYTDLEGECGLPYIFWLGSNDL